VRFRDTLGGWSWFTGANGSGKSLERRNPLLAKDSGQNWGDSTNGGGTPGSVNSLRTTNIAPIISDVEHSPAVPKSTEFVTISCKLTDESPLGALSATLFYRNANGPALSAFSSMVMIGNGGGRFFREIAADAGQDDHRVLCFGERRNVLAHVARAEHRGTDDELPVPGGQRDSWPASLRPTGSFSPGRRIRRIRPWPRRATGSSM
jgi:hypothetical protein